MITRRDFIKNCLASCVALNTIEPTKDIEPRRIVFTSGNHNTPSLLDSYVKECALRPCMKAKIEISRAETEFLKKMLHSTPKDIYGGCFADRHELRTYLTPALSSSSYPC